MTTPSTSQAKAKCLMKLLLITLTASLMSGCVSKEEIAHYDRDTFHYCITAPNQVDYRTIYQERDLMRCYDERRIRYAFPIPRSHAY